MRKCCQISVATLVLQMIVGLGETQAQVPYVQIYFDEQLQQTSTECPGTGIQDTLYVVVHNIGADIGYIEYQVSYAYSMAHLFDLYPPSATSNGVSGWGVKLSFSAPLPAFSPAVVTMPVILWECDGQPCQRPDGRFVTVIPHPDTGKLVARRWSDSLEIELIGMASVLCPVLTPVPTRNSIAVASFALSLLRV